jgi:UDP-glucuronate decarboxylase
MTRRLLITGGTGFFGRALLRHLHAEAESGSAGRPTEFDEVLVLSRNPNGFAQRFPLLAFAPWLRWVRADVTDAHEMATLTVRAPIDCVLHAATDSTDAAGLTALQQLDQIVSGTRNVLDAAVRLRARRFLLTSSGGVYGPQPANVEKLPEAYCGMPDPLKSGGTYGIGKRAAEHLCFLYSLQGKLESVIARCFAFVGEDLPQNAHFAIGNFIRDALHAEAITVGGDGSPIRSYLDQRDLAHWLLTLLLNGRAGEAYNVGSDQAIRIADLAHLVRDTLAPHKPVRILYSGDAYQHRNVYVPDVTKAQTELDLGAIIPLREAIAYTGGQD